MFFSSKAAVIFPLFEFSISVATLDELPYLDRVYRLYTAVKSVQLSSKSLDNVYESACMIILSNLTRSRKIYTLSLSMYIYLVFVLGLLPLMGGGRKT